LPVKTVVLDQATIHSKSKWEVGSCVNLSIEPHATVGMVKDRLALVLNAQAKFQEVSFPEGVVLDDDKQVLQEIDGLTNGSMLFVKSQFPPEAELPPVVVSDDEGLCQEEEGAELPDMPSADVVSKELSDEEMDKQAALKGESQDALEDGDLAKAVQKLSEAIMIGGVSAMMLAKRADMLVKQKHFRAAIADATRALSLNADSAKAYRVRGKAKRFLGEYADCASDLAQAQKIDYDDSVADMHKYVEKRLQKMQAKTKQDAERGAKSTAEAA